MARRCKATDFLTSLDELFTEAGEDGRHPHDNYLALREPLVQFIRATASTTSARARAGLDLTFTDGTQSKTFIQLFPAAARVKINDAWTERLRGAGTGVEFLEVVKTMIDDELRVKPAAARKRKKMTKADRLEADRLAKKAKIIVRLTAQRPTECEGAMGAVQPPDESLEVKTPRADDPVYPEGSAQHLAQTTDQPATSETIFADPTGSAETARVQRCSSAGSIASSENLREAVENQIKHEQSSQEKGLSQVTEIHGEHLDGPEKEGSNSGEPAKFGETMLETIRRETALITAVEWETYKPRLLETLAGLDYEPSITADAVSDDDDCASEGFAKAIALLQDELERIPPETWRTYEAGLSDFCCTNQAHKLPFTSRLQKIARICYLPEEEVAVVSRDWERLEAVVRICTLLAEMVGPAWENLDQAAKNKWCLGKLRDIQWLKKFFTAKEQIFGTRAAPSQTVGGAQILTSGA